MIYWLSMNTLYDLIIIGGGPAGTAAAVYAARKQLKTLLIVKEWGGQSIVSDDIQNWIGTPHIKGSDLAVTLKKHVEEYKNSWVEIKEGVKVAALEKNSDGSFSITLDSGQTENSMAILITAGSSRRQLTAKGADKTI